MREKILKIGGYAEKTRGTKSPTTSVAFPADMLQEARKQAKKEDITLGELIRIAVYEYLQRRVNYEKR